jgi:diguanylate cyclase (GGDEF)-like protein
MTGQAALEAEPGCGDLAAAIEHLCGQLCRAAAGDLTVRLAADSDSLPVQKLALLGNGVLHVARRAIAQAEAKERERAEAQAIARIGTWQAEITAGVARFTWSPELLRLLALPEHGPPPGRELLRQLVHPADRPRIREAWRRALAGATESYEWRAICPDGAERTVWTELRPTVDQGRVVAVRGVCQDVTERRVAEARIRHLAEHDALTGLHNRAVLYARLAQALGHAGRRRDDPRPVAVLCLDLHGFRSVNDRHGHAAGDRVLEEAARRMRAVARNADTLARLGADEFAILQTGADQPDAAQHLAARLVEALAAPVALGPATLAPLGAAIGIAIAPEDGRNADALLAAAGTALHAARSAGRNTVRLYHPGLEQDARERRALEADLHLAALRGEFHLAYQPVVAVAGGAVRGYEALLRWQHPQLGLIPPDRFIPIAEACGAILPIGEWALRQACHDALAWPADSFVAVNVSPIEIQHGPRFADSVAAVLAETRLPPHRLELEVTEGVLLRASDAALAALRQVRAMGVRVALDDFGTGYASLATLQTFAFDKIKIDRRFIAGLGGANEADTTIVRAVLGLARGLSLPVVAEGVETPAQLAVLQRERCALAQGWLFGRPLPAQALGMVA